VFHDAPEVAGEVVLEAAAGLAVGAGDGLSAVGVVAGAGSRTCRARLSWRSPPRLSRWRVTARWMPAAGWCPRASRTRRRIGGGRGATRRPVAAPRRRGRPRTRRAARASTTRPGRRAGPCSRRGARRAAPHPGELGQTRGEHLVGGLVGRSQLGGVADLGGGGEATELGAQRLGAVSTKAAGAGHARRWTIKRRRGCHGDPAGAGSCGMPLLPVSHRSGPKHGGSDAGS